MITASDDRRFPLRRRATQRKPQENSQPQRDGKGRLQQDGATVPSLNHVHDLITILVIIRLLSDTNHRTCGPHNYRI